MPSLEEGEIGGGDPLPSLPEEAPPSGREGEKTPVTLYPLAETHDPPPLYELLSDAEKVSDATSPEALAELEAALEQKREEESSETIPLMYSPSESTPRARPRPPLPRPRRRFSLTFGTILFLLALSGGIALGWKYRVPLIRGLGRVLVTTGSWMEGPGKRAIEGGKERLRRRLVLFEARRAMTELDGKPAVHKIIRLTGQILEKDPENEGAWSIRREVKRRLLSDAKRALEKADFEEARNLLVDARTLDPEDPEIRRLQRKLRF